MKLQLLFVFVADDKHLNQQINHCLPKAVPLSETTAGTEEREREKEKHHKYYKQKPFFPALALLDWSVFL